MIKERIERCEYHKIHTSDNYFHVQYEFLLKNGTTIRFNEDDGNLYDIQVDGNYTTDDDSKLLANDLYCTTLEKEFN